MPLHLSEAELRRIRDLQELLTTPPDPTEAGEWTEALHEGVARLFGTERSLLVLPLGRRGEVLVDAAHMAPETELGFRRAVVGTATEINEYMDPMLNRAMMGLALAGVQVWNRPVAEGVTGIRLADMPRLYPDLIEPGRLQELAGMTQPLPEGQALFHVFADPAGGARLGGDVLRVFRLLLPAFRVTAQAFAGDAPARGLRAVLDSVRDAAALYRNGVEVYRNRSLRRLLGAATERDELVAAMRWMARRFTTALGRCAPMPAGALEAQAVDTTRGRYRLTATRVDGGSDGIPLTVLVVAHPAAPRLPEVDALCERYGFTPRQAEVARLLARGLTNRAIAERLGISEHTARHHAQRVLEKVGTDTRKALGVRFLADGP
jgi:DNA-binding CsgD family transcriptional regulator